MLIDRIPVIIMEIERKMEVILMAKPVWLKRVLNYGVYPLLLVKKIFDFFLIPFLLL
jgi:hypothetical protein